MKFLTKYEAGVLGLGSKGIMDITASAVYILYAIWNLMSFVRHMNNTKIGVAFIFTDIVDFVLLITCWYFFCTESIRLERVAAFTLFVNAIGQQVLRFIETVTQEQDKFYFEFVLGGFLFSLMIASRVVRLTFDLAMNLQVPSTIPEKGL